MRNVTILCLSCLLGSATLLWAQQPALTWPVGQGFRLAADVLGGTPDRAILVLDGVSSEFPITLSGTTFETPDQAPLTIGTHAGSLQVCNVFGCSPTADFTIEAGVPPPPPTNLRLQLLEIASTLDGAALRLKVLASSEQK